MLIIHFGLGSRYTLPLDLKDGRNEVNPIIVLSHAAVGKTVVEQHAFICQVRSLLRAPGNRRERHRSVSL